jgi:hypothetical protein
MHAIGATEKRPCEKRIVALSPNWLPFYEAGHVVCHTQQTCGLVPPSSPADIDRLLTPTHRALAKRPRGHSGATPAIEWLPRLIPVRTPHHDVDRRGSFEGDTVTHCGASITWEFCLYVTRLPPRHKRLFRQSGRMAN